MLLHKGSELTMRGILTPASFFLDAEIVLNDDVVGGSRYDTRLPA